MTSKLPVPVWTTGRRRSRPLLVCAFSSCSLTSECFWVSEKISAPVTPRCPTGISSAVITTSACVMDKPKYFLLFFSFSSTARFALSGGEIERRAFSVDVSSGRVFLCGFLPFWFRLSISSLVHVTCWWLLRAEIQNNALLLLDFLFRARPRKTNKGIKKKR